MHRTKMEARALHPIWGPLGIKIGLGNPAALLLNGFWGIYVLRKAGFNYEGYLNGGFIFGAI